jgi:hypothetical protein
VEEPPETDSSNDGRDDEKMFITSSISSVQDSFKLFVWLWVIGIGAAAIGENDVYSLRIIPLMASVLILFAAVVVTIYVAWFGVPVLILRVPESFRSLAKFSFVLVWTLIPLWIYGLMREQSLNFGAFFEYIGLRGLFVAKLFMVGIVAFLISRHCKLPEYRSIQPYVLLPFACLFLGGWLAPEGDVGALQTGLTLSLVYYVGVAFATSLGFFLGQLYKID